MRGGVDGTIPFFSSLYLVTLFSVVLGDSSYTDGKGGKRKEEVYIYSSNDPP